MDDGSAFFARGPFKENEPQEVLSTHPEPLLEQAVQSLPEGLAEVRVEPPPGAAKVEFIATFPANLGLARAPARGMRYACHAGRQTHARQGGKPKAR